MTRCDHPQCPGHLGKFDSCRDEALYEMTLDGFYDSTGNAEFEGYYSLVPWEGEGKPLAVIDPDSPDARGVEIEPGYYIVRQDNSGFVDVTRYDTEAEARTVFDAAEKATRGGPMIDLESMTIKQRDELRRRLRQLDTCSAKIWHGPGHQSRGRCHLVGAHEVHECSPMGYPLRWKGDEGMTGSFDESPED